MTKLSEVVHRGEILRKSLGKRMKSLRGRAKKAAKGKAELDLERVRQEIDGLRLQLKEVLNLEATRAEADPRQRVDVIVDEEVFLEDVSIPVLLVLREELKYQKKLYRRLLKAWGDQELAETSRRIDVLGKAVEAALSEANSRSVEMVEIGDEIDEYLFST